MQRCPKCKARYYRKKGRKLKVPDTKGILLFLAFQEQSPVKYAKKYILRVVRVEKPCIYLFFRFVLEFAT